jgi:predicted dehydrogenase
MNIAIIGLGVMGQKHLRACKEENFNIVSLYDPVIPNSSYVEFLKTLIDADGVIVSSPTTKHIQNIIDCLDYNPRLKILCEKPVSNNTKDPGLSILAAYSSSIMMGQIERFNNAFIKLKQLLSTNREHIIQIKTIRVNNTPARENIACRLDIGIHDLDLCCNLCDAYPNNLNIMSNTDLTHENLSYVINGTQILNEISWHYPIKSRQLEILTHNGLYVCDLFKQKLKFIDWSNQEIDIDIIRYEPLRLELMEFKKMCELNTSSVSTLENNIRLLQLLGY